ncbi:C40 family peptidase [Rubrivirga litoralis]
MHKPYVRAAALLAALVVCTAVAAPPAHAQTRPASSRIVPAPTAPAASPQGAAATAAPRRRPVPRSARRALDYRPARHQAVQDSVVRRVSSEREVTVEELAANIAARSAGRSTSARLAVVESTLRADGPNWIGIPYRWGGTTRRGIDCSAFVQQYVRANLGIELPRTTAGQRYEGVPISKEELVPGDLVFFRRRGVRHVGVYLSGGEFIHASSSRGVTISELASSYWSKYYWMSRRIIEEPSGRRPTPRSEARRARG